MNILHILKCNLWSVKNRINNLMQLVSEDGIANKFPVIISVGKHQFADMVCLIANQWLC